MQLMTVLPYAWMLKEGRQPPPQLPVHLRYNLWPTNLCLNILNVSRWSLINFAATTTAPISHGCKTSNENFKSVLTNVHRNQPFKSPSYCNMKNFQFDYLLAHLPPDSQEVDAGEAAEEVNDTALAEGEEMQDGISSDNKTPNEVRELLHSLMKKSTILDECQVRIHTAVSKAVAVHMKEMFKPFTGYIDDMGHEVSTWRVGILSVRPKMIDCNYEE